MLLDSLVTLLIRQDSHCSINCISLSQKMMPIRPGGSSLGPGHLVWGVKHGLDFRPQWPAPPTQTRYSYPVTTVTSTPDGPTNGPLLCGLCNWDSCARRRRLIKSVVHKDAHSGECVCGGGSGCGCPWQINVNYQRWLEKSKGNNRNENQPFLQGVSQD